MNGNVVIVIFYDLYGTTLTKCKIHTKNKDFKRLQILIIFITYGEISHVNNAYDDKKKKLLTLNAQGSVSKTERRSR